MTDISKPLRVYVVEDSAIIQKRLAAAIESAGAELTGTSDNAQRAIRELPRLQPDLIFIDIALSSGTGFDVLWALQEGDFVPTATKVVLTNHVTAETRARSFRLGASDFFDKSTEAWRALELINKMAADRRRHGASLGGP